nr:dihydrofolate reductase family protein [Paenimyroides ceti]
MDICYKRQIQSIIIEGGLQTLQAFIQANIWDEARIFESNIVLNNGIKAPLIRTYKSRTVESVAEDRLLLLKNN